MGGIRVYRGGGRDRSARGLIGQLGAFADPPAVAGGRQPTIIGIGGTLYRPTLTTVSCAIAASVVCAAFSPSRKSSSE